LELLGLSRVATVYWFVREGSSLKEEGV